MTTPNLTFGIELEFICLRPKTDFEDDPFRSEDTGIGSPIYRTLLEQGIPATGFEDDDLINMPWPSHSRWRVEGEELALDREEQQLLPEGWVADSVELSSRKLHFFLDDWHSEIAAVLRVLRQVESSGCRFITNKSTGFHVHVGNRSGRIPLSTAKNVFQLATAFERLIDELHTVPRIAIPDDRPHAHCYYPPSFFHTYGAAYDEQKGARSSPLFNRLADIEAVQSYEELGTLFRNFRVELGTHCPTTGHNSSYNFDNLFAEPDYDRHEETLTGTIEFRQHTGTLDILEIVAWVSLVCQLVMFSGEAPLSNYFDLIVRGADVGFRLQDFLAAIGCTDDVRNHYINGNVIGVLPEEGSHLSGFTTNTPVDLLIAQNDIACEERCDRAAVKAEIDRKFMSGLYGIDSRPPKFTITPLLVGAELEKAFRTVCYTDQSVDTQVRNSCVKLQVLSRLAQLYHHDQAGFHANAAAPLAQ